jgi:FolB domain-containing protein
MTNSLKKMDTSLILRGLELGVYLGWLEAERKQKQKITLDIEMRFLHPPRACTTDDLEDTHCYDELIKNIKKHINKRQFRLVEHLGKELHHFIKQQFAQQQITLTIAITKKPPIANLTGGVSFYYGEKDIF